MVGAKWILAKSIQRHAECRLANELQKAPAKQNAPGWKGVMVAGEGFEPSKAEPGDLQSPPIGRSGNPPGSYGLRRLPYLRAL